MPENTLPEHYDVKEMATLRAARHSAPVIFRS